MSAPSVRFPNYGKKRRPPYLLQTLPFTLLDDHQAIGLAGVGLSGAVLLMMIILMVLMILMTISKNLHLSTMCFKVAPQHRCLAANLRIGIFNGEWGDGNFFPVWGISNKVQGSISNARETLEPKLMLPHDNSDPVNGLS